MRPIHLFSFLTLVFLAATAYCQDVSSTLPSDYFEVKIGDEVKRNVFAFGVARKFYFGNSFSIAPEVMVLGVPILCGTLRQDIKLGDHMTITPHFGVGLTPVGLPISETLILGGDWAYHLSSGLKLFVESRVYFFNKNLNGMGSGLLEIGDLNNKAPLVFSLGIGF